MKLKGAIVISVVLHLSLFVLAVYTPWSNHKKGETPYYVDLISMGDGSGGGGGKGNDRNGKMDNNSSLQEQTPPEGRMKDLTTQKEEPKSTLRYPDKIDKKNKKKKDNTKKKELITIVKKDSVPKDNSTVSSGAKGNLPSNVLKTGISSGGSGGGTGGGYGSGSGGRYGSGSGLGGFPYAYYIEAIRSKISNSWYNALVSPGLRGKLTAGVMFKIARNGQIRDLELELKSGNNSLDLSALRAVENASPFPPLPVDYPDNYLVVHFEFEWEKK